MTTRDNSIAVMPFVNMSNDPETDYFSDGVTDEIIGTLARVKGLRVAGRASSFASRARNSTSERSASDLG
jgi:adenylate cyclase